MNKFVKSSLSFLTLIFFLIIIILSYGFISTSTQIFGKTITQIETSEKIVFLTFDDSPSYNTNKILEILEQKNVSATFFLIGRNIDSEYKKDIVLDIHNKNHSIGTHSMNHNYVYTNFNIEISKSKKLIEDVIGEEIILYRPPYGFKTPDSIEFANSNNLNVIMWSSFPKDYSKSKDEVIKIVLKDLKPGSIIVLHDIGKNNLTTLDYLPTLIDEIREQGYQFKKLDDYVK